MSQTDIASRLGWVAVDWGTSNLRLWAMDADDGILARAESDLGLNKINDGGFETVLRDLVAGWLPDTLSDDNSISVIVCGMAGAKQGWCEAPYATVPARPETLAAGAVKPVLKQAGLDVHILPGLCQVDDPDVMRGEETQLVGFMADHPDFAGWVCLPGTHSKWARIANGTISGFRTYMSGEVFALLSQQSILRHSMQGADDAAAFENAIRHISVKPKELLHCLFGIRAGGLVSPDGQQAGAGAAILSGYVIGSEIADIMARLGRDESIALIGAGKLASLYRQALHVHDFDAEIIDAESATLGGLRRAHAALTKS
ncbi:2-keto-3-deoxy-galactonokinase [Thalassospira profundimaris]|uniref:2-keto-3-deoxy-galactonokinase n=1 Tax=Thalassospira profundimaris TaxID=502049 RepID=A0A367XLJ0_9PROT|nr:2-keto-3-deoxy-galactonokinase [Thalassospira profundimaris]